MFKQVIVANKKLDMSPGKISAMASHGAVSFLTEWLRRNVIPAPDSRDYAIKPEARIDGDLYTEWICGSFTKIILEAENEEQMKEIIKKAHEAGMINRQDFFNIVDESTEFLDIPQWAVIAFRPMQPEKIDPITGDLNLYGYSDKLPEGWE